MTDHPCPECGGRPTTESLAAGQLSALGYRHEDKRLTCQECGNEWQVGLPRGEPDDETWQCPACGGDFIPHFVYVYEDEARIRPKCQDCYYVPYDPIVMDVSNNGTSRRLFIGHHSVTGDREDAIENTYRQ